MNIPITISFTLADILKISIAVLLIGVLIYLCLVLKEAYSLLKSSNDFYKKNEEHIDVFVKDGSVLVHKASVVAESIPDEPLSFLTDIKSGFPFLQTIISLVMGIFGGNKTNK